MSRLTFPIDPSNPGHFYACCGLLELFHMSGTGVRSRFVLDRYAARMGKFEIDSSHELDLPKLLGELKSASITYADKHESGEPYDNAVRPVCLHLTRFDVPLDWWFKWFHEGTEHVKCWAGQVTTEKLMTELQSCLPSDKGPDDLLHTATMMKTKFGVDPRSAWSSLDVGYSPNEHNQDAATFPAVELLGAIGLQGFRPRVRKRNDVQYHLWPSWLGAIPARRAAIDPWDSLHAKHFRFEIAKRGQSYKYFTFAKTDREGQ